MSSHTNSTGKPGDERPSMRTLPVIGGPLDGGCIGTVEWPDGECLVINGHFYLRNSEQAVISHLDPLRCPACSNTFALSTPARRRWCVGCNLLFDPITPAQANS